MRRMVPVLMLIPAVVAGWFWWQAEQGRRAAVARVAQLEAARGGVPLPPEPVEGPVTTTGEPGPARTEVVRVPTGTDPAPYLKTIDELREQNAALAKELSTAKDASARADTATADGEAELKKVRAQMDDLREEAAMARRVADAVQAELRAKSDRLVRMETAEKLLQERAARAELAATRVATSVKEIDDLNRRREAFLTSLLRRFREVNDLYRNYAMNVQTRDGVAGPGLQAGDLSRIQSAIQQGEDELRQLQALNARMAQLARAK